MNVQKRLAAQIMKCSPHNVVFDTEHLSEIKEAITKADVRNLIYKKIISKKPSSGTSKFHARKIKFQKSKGRRKGFGSRKGKSTARRNPKESWMARIRLQRELLKKLKAKKIIDSIVFREIYLKSKGGFFRSKRHLTLYLKEKVLRK